MTNSAPRATRRLLCAGILATVLALSPPAEAATNGRILIWTYHSPEYQPLGTILPNGSGYRELEAPVPHAEDASPDGETIAYASDGDIYVVRDDGTAPIRLTESEAIDGSPRWSPDGDHLLFSSDRDGGDWNLYKMTSEGRREKQLTTGDDREWMASWAPDRPAILFLSDRDGDEDLYKMRADGSKVTKLTHNSVTDTEPAWSPDGRLIAFARYGPEGGMFVMRPDGTHKRRIHRYKVSGEWSPNSRRLVFYGDIENAGDLEIYTIKPDGTGLKQLTDDGQKDMNPHWSPNGRAIVFTAMRYSLEVFKISATGKRRRQVTHNRIPDVGIEWMPAPQP